MACLFAVLATVAHAEVIELEGTVKAVDATAGTMSVERKTPKGTKLLELRVNPKKAGDLPYVKVGDRITFSYDSDKSLVVAFTSSKPMTATHLLKVLRRLEEHDQGRATQPPEVIHDDQNFLFGYLMGIGDACRGEFTMPTGKEPLRRFREHLLLHLERNRDRLEQPAVELIREAGQSWQSQPAR